MGSPPIRRAAMAVLAGALAVSLLPAHRAAANVPPFAPPVLLVSTGLAGTPVAFLPGGALAIVVRESAQGGTDLNGDGDGDDAVVVVFDPTGATWRSTRLAIPYGGAGPSPVVAAGSRLVFAVSEQGQGATDLNGDGDVHDHVLHGYDPATGAAVNTGMAAEVFSVEFQAVAGRVAFGAREVAQGTDLNGDGDTGDVVLHAVDPVTGVLTNAGLAVSRKYEPGGFFAAGGGKVIWPLVESSLGAGGDRNGDGDVLDHVVHIFDPVTGAVVNTGLAFARPPLSADGEADLFPVFAGRTMFPVPEAQQGATDLNGDGDAADHVLHVVDLATGTATTTAMAVGITLPTVVGEHVAFGVYEAAAGNADLNGDGDAGDEVLHLYATADGTVGNARLALRREARLYPVVAAGGRLGVVLSEGDQGATDRNGDGDVSDGVAHVYDPSSGALVNTGLSTAYSDPPIAGAGRWLVIDVGEQTMDDDRTNPPWGVDLNGNDSVSDIVPHVYDTATGAVVNTGVSSAGSWVQGGLVVIRAWENFGIDLDRDGRLFPGFASLVYDPAGDVVARLGVATRPPILEGPALLAGVVHEADPQVGAPQDLNGDGDTVDEVVHVFAPAVGPVASTVGLVDAATGRWHLRDRAGAVTSFYYGNPGDVPFMGDWDCDGVDTPGLFRRSDAFVYLRNTNTPGIADVRFFFGDPGDVPLAGDFNGDGCDTVSLYRPSEQRFYVVNALGRDGAGLGPADFSFVFGNPGDQPVVGDWDRDGEDEIGLYRASSGFFYWRTTLSTGIADGEIYFGDPGDRFVAGDWGNVDAADTPGVFRPSAAVFYLRHTLSQGIADDGFPFGEAPWLPVAGSFSR